MRLTERARLVATTAGLLRSQWRTRREIRAHQDERLIAQLRYAVENVPFYAEIGLSAADIRSPGDLQRFPLVTKADIQDRGERFLSRGLDAGTLFRSRSSGVTGEPTVTYFDDESWLLTKHALKARRVLADTKAPRQRILIMSELPKTRPEPSLLRGLARPLLDLQSMSLTDPIEDNVRTLAAFRPTVIYGFPSYLLALADAAREMGLPMAPTPLIYTSSEVLSEPARRSLAAVYRGRVVDVYGSTEFKEIAVQCPAGRYHINFESVYVESVDDEPNGPPRLLVTTLVNKAMPLIRYELGDTGRLKEEECPCGRSSPQIIELQGRLSEMLAFPDGTRVSPYLLTTAIEEHASVKHFRIVHEQPAVLRVETLAAPPLSDSDRSGIERRLRKLLPEDVSVRFIALTERGAHRKRRAVSREF
jgi:phenylacetate-CoA ligase